MIQAQVIADSISPAGNRLTTIEAKYHRFVHSELMTHRLFSRNAASSRAIPVRKTIEQVQTNPAVPFSFPEEQKGMNGGRELPVLDLQRAKEAWLEARDDAVRSAIRLVNLGVHKSVVNRLLEPFSWITVIISATEWDGFFAQRCHKDAMPELRMAAEAIKTAYDNSTPTPLDYGQWHMPYVQENEGFDTETAKRVSVARCARVSYLTHDGKRDVDADLALYERLVTAEPPHASPLEHVAMPVDYPRPGNFKGWAQLRHIVLDF